jgi:CRISPR/Cas system-associated protein Cas10 (large subunit of type III CRISPR-Cas system)
MESHAAKHILSLYERHADEFARLRPRDLFEKSGWTSLYSDFVRAGIFWISAAGTVNPSRNILLLAALR